MLFMLLDGWTRVPRVALNLSFSSEAVNQFDKVLAKWCEDPSNHATRKEAMRLKLQADTTTLENHLMRVFEKSGKAVAEGVGKYLARYSHVAPTDVQTAIWDKAQAEMAKEK